MDLTRKASGARSTFDEMVGKECLVTFDFEGGSIATRRTG